jgi:hypothetical protein
MAPTASSIKALAIVAAACGSGWLTRVPDWRAVAQDADKGVWSSQQQWGFVAIHAHLLPDGRVLAWSRDREPGDVDDRSKAWIWHPATNVITPGYDNTTTNVFCAGHAFLPDGRLLVTGGHDNFTDGDGEAHTNIFDYRTNAWARVEDMNAGRWYPSTITLASGEVLTVSGSIGTAMNLIPQVWKNGGGWRTLSTASLTLPMYPWMHAAPNGRAFYAGPDTATRYLNTDGTGSWETLNTPKVFNDTRHHGSSVMYAPGKIMIVGGMTATAEVIDLTAPSPVWQAVPPMTYSRTDQNATVLPDGKVLVTGGGPLEAELWDPNLGTWKLMAAQEQSRGYHSIALLLPDGRVLSAGSGLPPYTAGQYSTTAEIYTPPYLLTGPRPVVTAAAPEIVHGRTFFVKTESPAHKVTLVRTGSVTHAFDQNQRFNELTFTPVSGGLRVTAPANANLAPPGHYMLFLLYQGVPSIAAIVRLGQIPTFNTDSYSDLVWQRDNGEVAAWMMAPGATPGVADTQTSGTLFTPSSAPPNWLLVATADANRDGKADLYFQNPSAPSQISVWHMNGLNRISEGAVTGGPANVPSTYKVRAAGDFNRDGSPDLIWQNTAPGTGNLSVWYLNDRQYLDGVSLAPAAVADVNWHIVGAADIANNGVQDGRTDLIWHHQTTGALSVWYMNGATLLSGEPLSPGSVGDTGWKVRGVGHFNNDVDPDLIWQKTTNGDLSLWLMSGKVLTDARPFVPGQVADLTWRLAGPR